MTNDANKNSHFMMCKLCSHPIPVPEDARETLSCERCGERHEHYKPRSASASVAFSLTALILYFPANLYPFMTMDLYGNRHSSTIWGGIKTLAEGGSWPIAGVVLLASIIIPFVKLVILFYLGFTAHNNQHPRFKTRLYHFVEAIGRWSMLDIFLLAVMVAVMKLGPWTVVTPEIGSLLFLGVVISTMLASAYFDPKLIWNEGSDDVDSKEN